MGRDHGAGHGHGHAHSSSSSIDSSNHPPAILSSAAATASSSSSSLVVTNKINKRDLSTDLKLGLSISPSTSKNNNINIDVSSTSTQREPRIDWPPIKSLLRSMLVAEKAAVHYQQQRRHGSLFVKVYKEGIPIGRKLDLFAHNGYIALVTTLRHMFRTPILYPDDTDRTVHGIISGHKHHMLIYEDKEGDWMMVGDVPWEMFLTTVRRLKITRADRC